MYGANLETIPEGVDGQAALESVRRRVLGDDGPTPGSPEAAIPYLRSDHILVRFLIARQWDVEKAVAMLKQHYEWLVEKKMASLLLDPFPEEEAIKVYYPQNYHGTDKQGRPLYIERPGLIDMPRLLQATTPERLLEYMYVNSELQIRRRFPACSLARGEVVDKSLNIMDLSNLGFRGVTHTTARRVLRDVVLMLQDHYPECSGRMIIINAPKVFSIASSFVLPMLDAKTVTKIKIYDTDVSTYSQVLLDLVDADQLPSLFGGRCICDGRDPNSCMRSHRGPWTNPEVMRVLEREPLETIMTPEGARRLCPFKALSPTPAERLVDGLQPLEVPEEDQPEAYTPLTSPAPDSPAVPAPSAGPGGVAMATRWPESLEEMSPERREAEMEVQLLEEERRQHEDMHLKSLTEWVNECNALVKAIGRNVIERAQSYYDTFSIWQQLMPEHAILSEAADEANCQLAKASTALEVAEAAYEAFLAGRDGLSEEQWRGLVPVEAASEAEAAGNPKLMRSLRLSALADRCTTLQLRREQVAAELARKTQELDQARQRFEEIDAQHSHCTRNCSVQRAAPYYHKRQAHEDLIEAQLTMLRGVEQRWVKAREHADRLAAAEALGATSAAASCSTPAESGTVPVTPTTPHLEGRSRRPDELSMRSFDLVGAEPQEDEYLSCASDDSMEEEEDG